MKNSARQLEEPSGLGELLREGFALTGAAIMRNPAAVGGTTAFLVAMAFVSANALWYQPYRHDGAFFRTRVVVERPQPADRQPAPARFEARPAERAPAVAEETTAALPKGDTHVQRVQEILKSLDLYSGDVDGLAGPQTASAVEHYRRLVGLEAGGGIDEALLRQLGAAGAEASTADAETAPARASESAMSVPIPSDPPLPQPRPEATTGTMQSSLAVPDPNIVRIQAGLKAFGNDGIELDGIVGTRTRDAIKEFQSLFGLPITGEPDAAVYAKMREIGLTD